jgi:cytidylate kinase
MAKGQKRSNREVKKPKQAKSENKSALTVPQLVSERDSKDQKRRDGPRR